MVRIVWKLLRIALRRDRVTRIVLHWKAGSVGVHCRFASRRLRDANTIIIIALLMVNDREVNLEIPSFSCDGPNPTRHPRAGGQAIAKTTKPFRWRVSSKDCRKNKVEPRRSK